MRKKLQPKPSLSIPVHVDLDMIIESMGMLSHNQLFEFIKEIDSMTADYDFTKRLRDFFIAEIRECDKDEPSVEDRFFLYEVQNGDTLSEIGQRFGVSWRRIAQLSRVAISAHIEPGWILIIPRKK